MSETSRKDTTSTVVKALPSPTTPDQTSTDLVTVQNHSPLNDINLLKLKAFAKKVDSTGKRIARMLWRLVMMGIVLHVAEHFAPELREHIPVIYQITDGGMMVLNFIFEWGIKLISAIVSGNFFSTNSELHQAVRELIDVFITWATQM